MRSGYSAEHFKYLSSLSNSDLREEFKNENIRNTYGRYFSHYLDDDGTWYEDEYYDALYSPDEYMRYAVVGTIPGSVSDEMGTMIEYNGKSIVTGSILLGWWDVYARSRDLIEDGYIRIDDTIRRAFKDKLLDKNVYSMNKIRYSVMRTFISQMLTPVYLDLDSYQEKILYDEAIRLNDLSSSFFGIGEMMVI